MNRGQLSVVSEHCLQMPFVVAALAILLLSFNTGMAQEQQPAVANVAGQSALIPEEEIVALEQALQDGGVQGATSSAGRRTFKNAARKGLALIKEAPEAANRFRVLSVIFQCQKKLLALENSEINRKAVFETCERMVKAPDDYAAERLDADLLLSEKEMSDKNAPMEERAQALAGIIERYRGTTAEVKSLLRAALIVQQLDAPELENEIYNELDERYADDHEVIEFRREHLKVGRLSVVFEGDFEYLDGRACSLPEDALGHLSLMVFWSKNKPGVENLMATVKRYQDQYPGRFTVFSLNIDELQDAGQSILRERGYDWKVLKMPGGRNHTSCQAYAQGDTVAILVNEYGYAVLLPGYQTDQGGWRGERSGAFEIDGARISDDRYTAQLQSLFIGDFLIWSDECEWPDFARAASGRRGASGNETNASSGSADIYNCFVQAPFRYRLTREMALENYTKAAALAADLLSRAEPAGPEALARELVSVRNARIVALMGMSSLACEPKYLEEAVKEAKSGLGSGAEVIPRFCMAKASLRSSEDAETVVTGFLKDCGGDAAPASALAAAAVLAIEAGARELHEKYRAAFLDKHGDDPAFYAFSSFLRDRHHRHRLLQPNYTLRERSARGYIAGHGYPFPTNSLPCLELTALDGTKLRLPEDTNGKLTYLLFLEPPAGGPTNDFPCAIDRNGKPTRNDHLRSVMGFADSLTKSHINNDINFIAAFLTDDADHVRYLLATNGWDCQAALVPGGLNNPMVRQLGILSADRLPNVFLLRRDGTVAWTSSSLEYKNDFGFPFAILLGMKVQVEVCEVETAYEALAKGDYREAARIFAGPFPQGEPDRYGWLSPRCHGKALAHIGLKEWEEALDSIDKAIDAHKLLHFRGRRSKNAADWQQDAATVVMKDTCDILPKLWEIKAAILDQLDRKEEAGSLRKICEDPVKPDRPNIYGDFHERLAALRDSKK